MLLKRVEKDGEIKSLFESSNILASTYNTGTKDLTIIFKGGKQYKYPEVKNTDYTRFELAESQGKIFNSHIKKYEFVKLDEIDITKIHEAIDDVNSENKAGTEKLIIDIMRTFIGIYDSTGKFPDDYDKYFDGANIELLKYKSIR